MPSSVRQFGHPKDDWFKRLSGRIQGTVKHKLPRFTRSRHKDFRIESRFGGILRRGPWQWTKRVLARRIPRRPLDAGVY